MWTKADCVTLCDPDPDLPRAAVRPRNPRPAKYNHLPASVCSSLSPQTFRPRIVLSFASQRTSVAVVECQVSVVASVMSVVATYGHTVYGELPEASGHRQVGVTFHSCEHPNTVTQAQRRARFYQPQRWYNTVHRSTQPQYRTRDPDVY